VIPTARAGRGHVTVDNVYATYQYPINRYAFESSWVTFRWGPKFGEPFPDTQFPIEAAETYYPQTISTYRDPQETRKSVAAFAALIDKVDSPVIIQTWSSSGLLGYLTAIERPGKVKGILAVETSVTAFGDIPEDKLPVLARIPIIIVIGDRAPDRVEASRAFEKEMKALGGDVTVFCRSLAFTATVTRSPPRGTTDRLCFA
jgi:pimeloyl-ACP methyl ester carboxylesterase